MAQFYLLANHFKMFLSQPPIGGVIMAEIKTGENASGELDQDQMDVITSKVCDVTKSRRSISDPTATTYM